MNSNLEDLRLDERLRDYLTSQADVVAAMAAGEAEMAERVGARVARRRVDQRWVLLAAAALLVALSAATAIAIGSGLLRWPSTSDRITAAGGPPCLSFEPSSTLVLDYSYQTANVASPSGYFEMSLDTAGRLISGPSGASAGLTIRLLSPKGVQLLVEQVSKGPFGSGCRTVDAGTIEHLVSVQSAAGVQGVHWGGLSGSSLLRPTTLADRDAALALQARLDHVEGWMPTDGWVDATPRLYSPDRWDIGIERLPPQGGEPTGPDPSGFRMPDGRSLADYATQGQSDRDHNSRCVAANTPFVNALLTRLNEAHAPRQDVQGKPWVFTETGGKHIVDVVITALRPHEPDCETPPSGPSPSPTSAGAPDPLATVRPCDLLSDEQMSAALGISVRGEGHVSSLDGPYRACVFFKDASRGHTADDVAAGLILRRQTTSNTEARELIREVFGGATERDIAGHRVYFNDCYRSAIPCGPAVAIAAEPYFVMVEINLAGKGDQTMLESLAHVVIANLTSTK